MKSRWLVCAFAAITLCSFGCSGGDPEPEIRGDGGNGGMAGAGGSGGIDRCPGVTCETECRSGGLCDPSDGACSYETITENGTACSEGECLDGVCAPVGAFPCTEQGIRDAIAEGGGPHFFACDGPTTVAIRAVTTININNDVILDGQGDLVIEARRNAFFVDSVAAELRGFTLLGNVEFPGSAGLWVDGNATLTITSCTVTGFARGIAVSEQPSKVTVLDSTISGTGDGILIWPAGGSEAVVELINSTLSDNGHGILNVGGQVTVTGSTLSGNQLAGIAIGYAIDGRPPPPDAVCPSLTRVVNSTVSGTRDSSIWSPNNCRVEIIDSTVSGNGDGLVSGNALLTNTLIDSCEPVSMSGTLPMSGGHNIESPGNTCALDQPSDQVDVPADVLKLGPLESNGGPTETHALGEGSVAIDAIPPDDCEVETDQRGVTRPQGDACDVGAVEME